LEKDKEQELKKLKKKYLKLLQMYREAKHLMENILPGAKKKTRDRNIWGSIKQIKQEQQL
jgi:hypothetical protein